MRRWNGWGDDTITYPLPRSAAEFLASVIGPATPPRDATLAQVIASVPEGRLPDHPLVTTEPEVRVRHTRGQSLPDWIAIRSGRIAAFPDGVAYPTDETEVRDLLRYAAEVDARLIPYGGGTSVVGHINPPSGDAPVLTVNLNRLSRLHTFDATSRLATFGAGVTGPNLEAQLRARGTTLGHFPQSFELSTLGGWIASRSSGQQSFYYGRIEDMFAGGHVETPAGPLDLPPHPASAAGPDLRQLILGSEGRFGIITEATVRVSPLPERESFHAMFFPDWESGHTAVREVAQARVPVSMLRLSNAVETETTLILAGHERLVGLAERALRALGLGDDKCLLLCGVTGGRKLVKRARRDLIAIAKEHGGRHVGQYMGGKWRDSRFLSPYLRNTLWELGYAVDTLETAMPWSVIPATVETIQAALRTGLQDFGELPWHPPALHPQRGAHLPRIRGAPGIARQGRWVPGSGPPGQVSRAETRERVHVFAHLSHIYSHGASFYVTYLFRIAPDPDETLRRWQVLKDAASQAIVAAGGTISHQHGVGTDHLPYLPVEKGELGMKVLKAARQTFDPQGLMNPGKLLDL
jgi:alkyldihydroxyacetonephosphate synthase